MEQYCFWPLICSWQVLNFLFVTGKPVHRISCLPSPFGVQHTSTCWGLSFQWEQHWSVPAHLDTLAQSTCSESCIAPPGRLITNSLTHCWISHLVLKADRGQWKAFIDRFVLLTKCYIKQKKGFFLYIWHICHHKSSSRCCYFFHRCALMCLVLSPPSWTAGDPSSAVTLILIRLELM